MRILHVLGKLDRGGVETWLVQLLAQVDRSKYAMDFMVHTEAPGAYDPEVRQLGAKIIPCLTPHQPATYALNLLRILREHGPYDVVHSHVHHFSGYVLTLAKLAGVPVRIAHSHTDKRAAERQASLPRKAYCGLMKSLLRCAATGGFAVSSQSGDSLFPDGWSGSDRWKLAYLGIDLSRFSTPVDRLALRRQLGLDQASIVVGHVGRVDDDKNQRFIVDIAAELLSVEPQAMFLLVGQGPRLPEITRIVKERNLSSHFVMTGQRSDVPLLLRGAMDVFLFPSIREGLPITLLEAQAAGLRCLVSENITCEAAVIDELIEHESLHKPASDWARSVIRLAHLPRLTPDITCPRMESRSIRASCRELLASYEALQSLSRSTGYPA